jgi:hypothetical protein
VIGAALVNEDPARAGLLFLCRTGSSPTSNCARASGFSTCHSDGWEPLRTVAARAVARWDVRLQEGRVAIVRRAMVKEPTESCLVVGPQGLCANYGVDPDHHPPNQMPIPWTMPIGKNAAAAISSGRAPLAAQKTIDVTPPPVGTSTRSTDPWRQAASDTLAISRSECLTIVARQPLTGQGALGLPDRACRQMGRQGVQAIPAFRCSRSTCPR